MNITPYQISLSWKHQAGITVNVFARSEGEAKVMALNSPDAAEYLAQHPLSMPLMSCVEIPSGTDRFIADFCETDPSSITSREDLYKAFRIAGGHLSTSLFFGDLSTRFENVIVHAPDRRLRCFRGVRIKPLQPPTRQ